MCCCMIEKISEIFGYLQRILVNHIMSDYCQSTSFLSHRFSSCPDKMLSICMYPYFEMKQLRLVTSIAVKQHEKGKKKTYLGLFSFVFNSSSKQ